MIRVPFHTSQASMTRRSAIWQTAIRSVTTLAFSGCPSANLLFTRSARGATEISAGHRPEWAASQWPGRLLKSEPAPLRRPVWYGGDGGCQQKQPSAPITSQPQQDTAHFGAKSRLRTASRCTLYRGRTVRALGRSAVLYGTRHGHDRVLITAMAVIARSGMCMQP